MSFISKISNQKIQYLLLLADNNLILGQRLAELCGHGPVLEQDIALTNISLDLIGQANNYYEYASKLSNNKYSTDQLALLRKETEYRNLLLCEQPNTDFAFIIARQFFYDSFHKAYLMELIKSNDFTISAIAKKSLKEVKYHYSFSKNWMLRLGDGTQVSNQKIQHAVNELARYVGACFVETEVEKIASDDKCGLSPASIKDVVLNDINYVLNEANLESPNFDLALAGGKEGMHSEHMGFILSKMQFMQLAYPNMEW